MSNIKGSLGEDRVSSILRNLPRPDYMVGNNILLSKGEGKPVQIDHVVISIYGVFVIETKNYKGKIVGFDDEKYWWQYTGNRKYKIYSPIRQNYGHMMELKRLLNPNMNMVSIVCFTERSSIRIKTNRAHVIHAIDVVKVIKGYDKQVFSHEQVMYMVNKIRQGVKDFRVSGKHHNASYKGDEMRDKSKLFKNGIVGGFWFE